MQQNKVEIIDRGWESMHEILEREMPQKDRRRGLLFWLSGLGIGLLLISSVALFDYNSNDINSSTIVNNTDKENQMSNENQNLNENQNEDLSRHSNLSGDAIANEQTSSKSLGNSELDKTDAKESRLVATSESQRTQNYTISNETSEYNNHTDLSGSSISKTLRNQNETKQAQPITNPNYTAQSSLVGSTINNAFSNNQSTDISTIGIGQQKAAFDSKSQTSVKSKNAFNQNTESDKASVETSLFPSTITSIDLIGLIPIKPYALDLPEVQEIPIYLALVKLVKPIEDKRKTYLEMGATGMYAHNATGKGIESYIGIRREVSPTLSVLFHAGIGFLNLDNPPNLGELDSSNSRSDVPIETGGPQGPQGPQGASPEETVGDSAGGDIGGMFDMEDDLELTAEQIKELSLSNLDEMLFTSGKVGILWSPNRKRFHIGANVGIDYVLNLDFNQLYIADNQLTFDNSFSNNLTVVDLNQDASVLPFAELRTSYSISKLIGIDLLYKNYFKSVFPSQESTWLNQFKLGIHLSLPMKNK